MFPNTFKSHLYKFEVVDCSTLGSYNILLLTVTVRHLSLVLYRPANDPGTANDPQIGPQMIPGLEMIPRLYRK